MHHGFRRARGRVVLRLADGEAALLEVMLNQLLDLVVSTEPVDDDPLATLVGIGTAAAPPDDPALARLLPDAYRDDADAAADFRRYTERELRYAKCGNAETVERTLRRATAARGATLSRAEVSAWLLTLNDLRLVLGTRLDVGEDWPSDYERMAPDDPARMALEVYDWLTWLQGSLVELLTPGTYPEGS